jgi:hypothetical protein
MRQLIPLFLLAPLSCGTKGGPAPLEELPQWSATEDLRIGSVDDEETALTWFRGIVIGPQGQMATAHRMEAALRIHDADGNLIAMAGGQGEGPGEFSSPGVMGLVGDSIWVLDYSLYRFSYFDWEGRFLSSFAVPIDLGTDRVHNPPRPEGLFADGTIRGASPAWSREVASGELTKTSILRINDQSEMLDSIVSYSLENTTWAIFDPDRPDAWGSYGSQPFCDTELVEVSPYAMRYAWVDRAVSAGQSAPSFGVTVMDFDGDTLFTCRFGFEAVPIPESVVDSIVDSRAAFFDDPRYSSGATVAQAAEWGRDNLYVPEHFPSVSQLLWGRDNTLWLKAGAGDGDMDSWLCLSDSGDPLGRVSLPKRLRVMAIDSHFAWGMEMDELDVPYIVRYRIEPLIG